MQKQNQTKVRPAGGRDAPFIGRLSGKVFGIYGPYGSLVSQWFASGMTITLVALVDGAPGGFAMLGPALEEGSAPHAAELLALAVEPEYQRRGVGTLLMREMEGVAREYGVKKIFLHTSTDNAPAQKLFERSGFLVHGLRENFYPAGQDALLMSREIDLRGRSERYFKVE